MTLAALAEMLVCLLLPRLFAQTENTAAALSVVFEKPGTRHEWTLPELTAAGFDLPSDWSGYNFLVLDMRASTREKFDLRIKDNGRWWRLMVYPLQDAWLRACIPLQYYRRPDQQGVDVAALGNKSFETFFLGLTGARAALTAISALGVEMADSFRSPRLEIRNIQLTREPIENKLLETGPLVDEFGQWISDNWPGKATGLEQLRTDWRAEEQAFASPIKSDNNNFGYGKFGGFANSSVKPMRATGFFRVEKQDGRWWLVDPEGLPFFSTGANRLDWGWPTFVHKTTFRGRHYNGRENMFAALPADSVPMRNPWLLKGEPGVSFHMWNLLRRHGEDAAWSERWRELVFLRMADWGLNTVPSGAAPALYDNPRAAYSFIIYDLGVQDGVMGMPDVHAPEWEARVDAAARRQCAPRRDDPWLLGYFLGNEPPFPRRESLVVDAILNGPATATRRHLRGWLDDLEAGGDTRERRVAWVYDSYKRFLEIAGAAVRRHDPNHLILGARYASPNEELLRVSRDSDVVSFNCYQKAPAPKTLATIARLLDKPVLVGEFSFGAAGRGMAGMLPDSIVPNHAARADAYQHYLENAAANPAVVGAWWYSWVDEPATGRPDGECYNIGLVDVTDRPYPELIDAMRRTHRRLGDIHAGK